MKTTVVPAQITTVEDKIAGNLSFTQLLLMTTPVFLSGAIFAFVPPLMNLRSYKVIACVALAVICLTLSIRIKGKILLLWISTIGRYNVRPRYYLFNKNDSHLRSEPEEKTKKATPEKSVKQETKKQLIPRKDVPPTVLAQLENIVADPRAMFHFKTTKKGVLSVHIQEIK